MLTDLSIQNVVLIERLALAFRDGLCVLTGETGAGKSILLDALGLALGARAESRLVRKGADQAQVTASFDLAPTHPVFSFLEESGISFEAGEALLLRRSLGADGRSRAFINDQSVSAALLRQVGEMLVEIHGQFDTQALLNPSTHRGLLDEYAMVGEALSALWMTWQNAQNQLEDLKKNIERARTEEQYLREAVEDLDALDPQKGEEETLAATRERLMNREHILEALGHAYDALSNENDPVRIAWSVLDKIAGKGGQDLEEAINALERASAETQEALSLIQSASADLSESEYDLETIDERLFALRAQARKHDCAVDDLAATREKLATQLAQIDDAGADIAAREQAVAGARTAYVEAAQKIADQRKSAAQKLDGLVATELEPLKLGKASFVTQLDDLDESEWGPHGTQRVRFLVATNPGSAPGPLNKIASGGEMSRFMLALKVVLAEVGIASTLIFDEVDAGIGGATADAVGERLARLAHGRQILVVTHAAQVAARATHHYVVSKSGADDVRTSIIHLEHEEACEEEIARMIAGATITEEARAAARKLLDAA